MNTGAEYISPLVKRVTNSCLLENKAAGHHLQLIFIIIPPPRRSMGHAITAEVGSSLICDVLEGNVISVPRTRRSHPIFGKVPMLSVGDVRAKWPDPASFLLFLKSGTLQK